MRTAEYKQDFVQILAAVVEMELAFFEMQVEGAWVHSSEPRQSCFSVPPEAHDEPIGR